MLGFDSVTIFRLDAAGHGARVAEDTRSRAANAVHCPPPEIRILADAAQRAVALEPDVPPALVERALLRAWSQDEPSLASPKEAASSICIPLVSAGMPWGVAVCLNRTARQPTLDRIAAAELFGDLLAMRAELLELREREEA